MVVLLGIIPYDNKKCMEFAGELGTVVVNYHLWERMYH